MLQDLSVFTFFHDGKVGVGAAVYFTLSAISLSTLGLVGIGAGVGYGVGSWAVDKIRQKRCEKQMDRHRIQANFTHESFSYLHPSVVRQCCFIVASFNMLFSKPHVLPSKPRQAYEFCIWLGKNA